MIKPYWFQEEAVNSIFKYFFNGNAGHPLVALPTGTGKSVCIAKFIETVLRTWPNQRILSLTHVKELVEQNAERLRQIWELAPVGINCAAFGQRDTAQPVIFGSNKSVVSQLDKLGRFDLMIIDEAHLLSPKENSTYQKIITHLLQNNPNLKVIGFTATPYRKGQGLLTDKGGLFTHICYDMTTMKNFNRLIYEGFLASLVPRPTNVELDVSQVKTSAGDYVKKELQEAVDKKDTNKKALQELVAYGQDRTAWLVFASGVDHCNHLCEILHTMGVSAASIHSKSKTRDEDIAAFKQGELRCLVTNNVLTTGFDHPPIDMIGMLRPTRSVSLWVQMLGRGTRPCKESGKRDCLVLDFAKNTASLGPINDPKVPGKPGKKGGEAPIKICDVCTVYNHPTAKFCIACGTEFEFKSNLANTSSTDALIKIDDPIVEYFKVDFVTYAKHEKQNMPPSIKVQYICGMRSFNEWVCPQHAGYAYRKAVDWWQQRSGEDMPRTTQECLAQTEKLMSPRRIRVWTNKKFPEILGYEY